jgi:hypothetical protein
VLLLGSSNKYSADNQTPIIYPGLAPHCVLALAHYAFTAAINFFRLLAYLQDNPVNRNNIYVPVLPEKRNDRIVPAPPIKLNRLRRSGSPGRRPYFGGAMIFLAFAILWQASCRAIARHGVISAGESRNRLLD